MPDTDANERPTMRQQVEALRYVPPLLKMVWETHPGYTLTMAALRLLRSAIPVATLWVGKLILDAIVGMRESTPDLTYLWKLIGLEVAIVLVGEALARGSSLVESLLGDLFSNHTSVRLMEHAATLDLYHFEDPAFYDQLERARRQTTGRIGLLAQLLGMTQDALTLMSFGAALLVYSPWLLLLLAVTVLPSFLGETHFATLEYSLLYRYTPERRRLDYLRYIGASDETAKEVQMFGLAPWLIQRFKLFSRKFYEENKRLSIRRSLVSTGLSIIGTAGYYSAYIIIVVRAVKGLLSLGSLTFLAGAFARSRDLIQRLLLGASGIYQQCLYLKDLFDFFEMKPAVVNPPAGRSVPASDPARDSALRMSAFVIRERMPGLFVMSASIFGPASASLSSVKMAPARRRSQSCLPACTTQPKGAFFWTMSTCANMTSARCGRPSASFFRTSCGTIFASKKILASARSRRCARIWIRTKPRMPR